jgi:Uma2 family endonuclease
MTRVMCEGEEIRIPAWVRDLASFRRWTCEEEFPERGHIWFLAGEVWIDVSREQLFTHNQVRGEIATVLGTLINTQERGRYFGLGAYLSSDVGGFMTQPDLTFVSYESFRNGRVRVSDGEDELIGGPDMLAEVVSTESVEKDDVILRGAYAAAGVGEYWIIDARCGTLRFDVLVLADGGYRPARHRVGWKQSLTFGRWFRLTCETGLDGHPEFTLEFRTERP